MRWLCSVMFVCVLAGCAEGPPQPTLRQMLEAAPDPVDDTDRQRRCSRVRQMIAEEQTRLTRLSN